jgi:hypothetical protein
MPFYLKVSLTPAFSIDIETHCDGIDAFVRDIQVLMMNVATSMYVCQLVDLL